RSETPVRREIRRSDRHGLEQQSDRACAIATLRELPGRFTQRRERPADILLRGLRSCESAVRIDVAPLRDELAERDLRLPRLPTLEKLRRRFGRTTVAAVRGLLRRCACREGGRKLARTLIARAAFVRTLETSASS